MLRVSLHCCIEDNLPFNNRICNSFKLDHSNWLHVFFIINLFIYNQVKSIINFFLSFIFSADKDLYPEFPWDHAYAVLNATEFSLRNWSKNVSTKSFHLIFQWETIASSASSSSCWPKFTNKSLLPFQLTLFSLSLFLSLLLLFMPFVFSTFTINWLCLLSQISRKQVIRFVCVQTAGKLTILCWKDIDLALVWPWNCVFSSTVRNRTVACQSDLPILKKWFDYHFYCFCSILF